MDLKSPVTGKRTYYCVKKENGQFIKNGPEIVYDILGKIESKNYYNDGVLGAPPTTKEEKNELLILNSNGPEDALLAIEYSKDDSLLAISSSDLLIRVFDHKGKKKPLILKSSSKTPPLHLSFSKDKEFLSATYKDGLVIVFNLIKGQVHNTLVLENTKSPATFDIVQKVMFLRIT